MDEQTAQTTQEPKAASESPPKSRPPLIFVLLVLSLIAIFIFGLKWIFGLGQGEVGSVPFLVFDYAVGLTMIFLPCTLPLAFVIVPMVMGKSYQKGIGMVLAFGLGVTVTLSLYGALIGLLGQVLGVNQVETAKNILYALAGLMAILFALGELGLIKFKSPTYAGGVPQFIMKQKDIAKAGLLGLFMGNVGVGCPNPLFNAVIIPQIVATGSPFQGFIIMVVQALGRITPLFILAFLAILGINATSFLVAHKDKVTKITAWVTLYVGGFLLTLGLFGHDWWVLSGIHTLGEKITQENAITNLLGSKVEELGHGHTVPTGTGLFGLPITLGTLFLIAAWILPMLWYLVKREKAVNLVPQEQQAVEKKYLSLLTWFFVLVFTLITTVFGYLLPHMFADHWSKMGHEEKVEKVGKVVGEQDFHIQLSGQVTANKLSDLFIQLHDANRMPILDLQENHERILHVILVSEDLEEFLHVHPEDNPSTIELDLAGYGVGVKLTKAGRYRVLADGFRKEIGEVSDVEWLQVGIEGGDSVGEPVIIRKDLRLNRMFGDYEVSLNLNPENPPKSGEKVQLSYVIRDGKTGKPIFDLEQYLGADMHLAIMPIDLSTILHTHGVKLKQEDNLNAGIALPEIRADYVFPYPGLWKIYGQFKHKGKVVTTEFMVEVAQGVNQMAQPQVHMDDNKH